MADYGRFRNKKNAIIGTLLAIIGTPLAVPGPHNSPFHTSFQT